MEIKELEREIRRINDPRRERGNKRHKLEDNIIIGLCSNICRGEDFADMEELGRDREEWLSGFPEVPNGIPDSDTFRRVFERSEPNAPAKSLNQWLNDAAQSGGRSVNIDGKTICGSRNAAHSAYHVLSARADEKSITLGELAAEEKHSEITAIPELLDMIDICGDIVTIDAMGCQTEIAQKIRDKKADYVPALKENQETLHEDVREYFDWIEREHPKNERCDRRKSTPEKGRGRIEAREILTASAQWLENREQRADIQTLIRYRRTREINGMKTVSVRHYISSFETNAEGFGEIIRGHWSAENQLHWMLDAVFREDDARARKDHSPLNLNILRKIVIALLKKVSLGRLATRKKMMKAARDPNSLPQLLFKK